MWGADVKVVNPGNLMPDDMLKSCITTTQKVSAKKPERGGGRKEQGEEEEWVIELWYKNVWHSSGSKRGRGDFRDILAPGWSAENRVEVVVAHQRVHNSSSSLVWAGCAVLP